MTSKAKHGDSYPVRHPLFDVWRNIFFSAILVLASTIAVMAQNATVIGPITPGNLPQFNSTTVVKDSGIVGASLPVYFTPEQFSAKGDAVKFTDNISISAGGSSLSVTTARFTAGDVGKLISISGVGSSITTATIAAAGSGYTPGSYAGVTVQGGTCTTQPTLTVGVQVSTAQFDVITNAGACTVQPANPVSVSAFGGGTGATFNLAWAPLATTINSVADSQHVALAANASGTISSAPGQVVYGTDDTAAVQAALTAANNRASSLGTGTAGLCGRYAINTNGGIALTVVANDGFSILGTCPKATLFFMGSTSYWGMIVQGTGDSATTTGLTANQSYGDSSITVTSAAGFSVGKYIRINSQTSNGDQRAEINQIASITGSVIGLTLPLPFDIDHIQPATITLIAGMAARVTEADFDVDCTGNSGGVIASRSQWLYFPTIRNLRSHNCSAVNAQGFYMFNLFGGYVKLSDEGSGWSSGTDAAALDASTDVDLTYQGYNANGFGFGVTRSSSNRLNLQVYNACCRQVKFAGSANNTGSIMVGGAPPGWVNVAFDFGTSYNKLGTVVSTGGFQCIWSSGKQNINNSIDDLQIANCSGNGLSIQSTDTGWRINNITRFANVAADSLNATNTNLGTLSAVPTLANTALPTCGATTNGWRYLVNTATAATFGSTTISGGAVTVPVVCNGSSWIQG